MNAWESRARLLKSQAIVDALWAAADADQRRDPRLADCRQHSPSDETWAMVVDVLCRRIQVERRGEPDSCPDCVGGEIALPCERHGMPCPCATEVVPCPSCEATGAAACECCREPDRPGTIVTPAGLLCGPCARDDFPSLERHARMLEDPFVGLTGGQR